MNDTQLAQIKAAIQDGFALSNQRLNQIMDALAQLTAITTKLAADWAAFLASQASLATAVAAQKSADETAVAAQVTNLTNLDTAILAATPPPAPSP
jgi:hypothetical protein